MKRISALFDPYRALQKEIYVLFISKIINAMGCFVMPLLTLILTEKIGFAIGPIIGGLLYENYLPLVFNSTYIP